MGQTTRPVGRATKRNEVKPMRNDPSKPFRANSWTRRSARLLCALAIGSSLVACGGQSRDPVSVTGEVDKAVTAQVGAEVSISLLQSSGPWASPPEVSSGSVQFLDMTTVSSITPGGPGQRFRFRAVAPGRAVITFHRTQLDADHPATAIIDVQ